MQINQYANSMFRLERLSDHWVGMCAEYVRHVFRDTVKGATVVDYAFGRGNWSLAFLEAGAAKVYAIDAAEDNVRRFGSYCQEHGIGEIEVIEGNILTESFDLDADILWLYGILPCIADLPTFLERILTLARPTSVLFVYAYNQGSLRQFVVDSARDAHTYSSEAEFLADSPLFTRVARQRARDDLTAPHVAWARPDDLRSALRQQGIFGLTRTISFDHFLHGRSSEEFQPFHWLCGLDGSLEQDLVEPQPPYQGDIDLLSDLATFVWKHLPGDRRRASIGLFNAHFGALNGGGSGEPVVLEDFLFLTYLALAHDMAPDELGPGSQALHRLALASLSGEQPTFSAPPELGPTYLGDYLLHNRIRL